MKVCGNDQLRNTSPIATVAHLNCSSIRRAIAWFGALEFPVTEANRFLGLPAIEAIGTRLLGDDADPYQMAGVADPDAPPLVDNDLIEAENLAAFPNQNARGRNLIGDIATRIAVATEFINSLN